jgi:outer membrane protein OmpA-like peptidoglycan-associated protein
MSKQGTYLVKPLRIAILCASALMLSTAFAEDGSNLSDIQYHPGSGSAVNTGMNASLVPVSQNSYLNELREIEYRPGSNSGHMVKTGMDASAVPADHNGYLSELRELQYRPDINGGHTVDSWVGPHIVPADLDGDGSNLYEIQYHASITPKPYVYNIDNAAYFSFNEAVLSDTAKAALDRMVAKMDQADSIRSVTITGHADTIGTTPYNRTLAFRRADAVKAYLVSKGIPSDSILTESEGSADPLVSCTADKTMTDKINCLAPDRRADVDALLASHTKTGSIDINSFHS